MSNRATSETAKCPPWVCAVTRRRFPVGVSPTRQPLQPEATGAAHMGSLGVKAEIQVFSCLRFLWFDRAAGFLSPRPRILDAGERRGYQGRPSLRHRARTPPFPGRALYSLEHGGRLDDHGREKLLVSSFLPLIFSPLGRGATLQLRMRNTPVAVSVSKV